MSQYAADASFGNLDDPEILERSMRAVSSSVTRNFVLDFGDSEAWVTFDLNANSIQTLVGAERPAALNTRWLNIWYPYDQRPALEALARRYDFSPRLLALMCSDPRRQTGPSSHRSVSSRADSVMGRSVRYPSPDVERTAGDRLSQASVRSSENPARSGNLYDIVDDVWHYTSVDQGRNYLCLGYNSIYYTGSKHLGEDRGRALLPGCKRLWTWLVLMSDKTVVTINEDPFPYSRGRLTHLNDQTLVETRRNLINVFRSLSRVEDPESLSPLTLLPIRKRLGDTEEETAHRTSDAPGLLFYYLFENWFNSYSLVTRKESRYGIELDNVRREMFQKPQLRHIDQLDRIGNQLGVLKRHYKAYIRIIDRVVEPQTATIASLENSRITSKSSHDTFGDGNMSKMVEAESLLGVSLSSAARVRFERLKDIISLYALSEVKDYLHEKDGLVQMNFQLLAVKTANFSERLTRVALFISKATILFLPVTLMSTYFGMPLENAEYTVGQYWISFAVVLFLSWIVLVVFGIVSGTMDNRIFYQPIRRLVERLPRSWRGREVDAEE